jgi:hypothetical protein
VSVKILRVYNRQTKLAEKWGQKKSVSEKLSFFCPHFSASLPR